MSGRDDLNRIGYGSGAGGVLAEMHGPLLDRYMVGKLHERLVLSTAPKPRFSKRRCGAANHTKATHTCAPIISHRPMSIKHVITITIDRKGTRLGASKQSVVSKNP